MPPARPAAAQRSNSATDQATSSVSSNAMPLKVFGSAAQNSLISQSLPALKQALRRSPSMTP